MGFSAGLCTCSRLEGTSSLLLKPGATKVDILANHFYVSKWKVNSFFYLLYSPDCGALPGPGHSWSSGMKKDKTEQ